MTSAQKPGKQRKYLVAGGAGLAVLAVLVLLVPFLLRHRGGPTSAPQSTGYGPAPAYTLTDQQGRTVKSTQFAGKVQVVSYLFPYCTTYCPVITRNLVVLRQQLVQAGLGDKVQLVAFNVDPAGAGPEQMRAFWSEFGGDPTDPGFEYLTGTPDQIHTVVAGGFHVYYEKVTGTEEPSSTDSSAPPNKLAEQAHVNYDIQHNDFIEIVDGHGNIQKIFDSGSDVSTDTLMQAVRTVLG